ncbi:MAG: Mrp/NBP35 family ATP-binding protein [Deltaproteobacteria bacterium]|nr:Mrp/NBP35 family ATP-binding protein [Deltaproteobacteria bacterium]
MKKIFAVASGKGGVGKSTVAVNLAVALANLPAGSVAKVPRVALVDLDFYGPSVPTIMGGGSIAANEERKLVPARKFNVDYISISFFLKADDEPVIWRGPMFSKAIMQLFQDVEWPDIDVCIVDLPPGTGDAQLSLSQIVNLDGAILVTTPQELAVSDVRRAINMFRKVNVDVVGIVENMNGFVTPSGERFDIFGTGGGESLAKRYGIKFLGSIPLDIAVREGGDSGNPIAINGNSATGEIFRTLAKSFWERVQSTERPRLKVIN